MSSDTSESATPRYEYRVEPYDRDHPLEEVLNGLGAHGWKYVDTADPDLVILERRVDDDER